MKSVFPDALVRRLKAARKIVVLTGAGFSSESGIPTFRDKGGLWDKANPAELASAEAFRKDPQRVLEFYSLRRADLAAAGPNKGHFALTRLFRLKKTVVVTQNVDGLHSMAGSPDVIELHGNLLRDRCDRCGRKCARTETTGHCNCGGRLRPDVVWFGETLPEEALKRAFEESGTCDFFVSAGTSATVQPAASLPLLAVRGGAFTVEINLHRTPLSDAFSCVLTGRSGEIMPQLVNILEKDGPTY